MFFLKALFTRVHELLAPVVGLWSLWQLIQGEWLAIAVLLAWCPLWLIDRWRWYRANFHFLNEREILPLGTALLGLGLVLMLGERNIFLWGCLAGLFSLLLNTVLMVNMTRGVREGKGDHQNLHELSFTNAAGLKVVAADARLLMFVSSGTSVYSAMQLRDLAHWLKGHAEVEPASVAVIFADQIPTHMPALFELLEMDVQVWSDTDGSSARELGLWLRGASPLRSTTANALRPAMAVLPEQAAKRASDSVVEDSAKAAAAITKPSLWLVSNNLRLPPTPAQLGARVTTLLAASKG